MSRPSRRLLTLLLLCMTAALFAPETHCQLVNVSDIDPSVNAVQSEEFCTASTYFNISNFEAVSGSPQDQQDEQLLQMMLCLSCDPLCTECFGPSPSQCYTCSDRGRVNASGDVMGNVSVVNGFVQNTTRDVLMCLCAEGFMLNRKRVCVSVDDSDSFPLGGIIGAAAGGGVLLLVALLCLCGCVCYCRRKAKSKTEVFRRIDDEHGDDTLSRPTYRNVFSPSKDVPNEGIASTPNQDLQVSPDSDNPLYMHSFDASVQKPASANIVRESGFSDTVEGLSTSPGGQSYVKMNPAGNTLTRSLEDVVEGTDRQGAITSSVPPPVHQGEPVSFIRPQALSDPVDRPRGREAPATPPPSPNPSHSRTSPLPKSPRSASPLIHTSPYPTFPRLNPPTSPRPNPPTSPRPKSPRPPPPSTHPKPSPRHQPSPHRPSPRHRPSPPHTPPPPPTQQFKEAEEDTGGVEEYVDPQVFQEDLQKLTESYVNKETIQEHTGMSRENSLADLTELEDKPEPNYDYVPHEHEFRYGASGSVGDVTGVGVSPRHSEAKQTGSASFGSSYDGELLASEERKDDYETVEDFLGQNPAPKRGEKDEQNYYNIPEYLGDSGEERYENVREEGGHLPDNYQSIGEIRSEQLLRAGGSLEREDSDAMRKERLQSMDNQYVDMQRSVSGSAKVRVLSTERKYEGKQTRTADGVTASGAGSHGSADQNGVAGGVKSPAEETLPLYMNVVNAGGTDLEEEDIGGEELYQNVNP